MTANEIVIGEITITKLLNQHGEPVIRIDSHDGHGGPLSPLDTLGMLAVAVATEQRELLAAEE